MMSLMKMNGERGGAGRRTSSSQGGESDDGKEKEEEQKNPLQQRLLPAKRGRQQAGEEEKVEEAGGGVLLQDEEGGGAGASAEGEDENAKGVMGPGTVLTVMEKRWVMHFPGRHRLLAYLFLLLGTAAVFMLSGLWTQSFYPGMFNSRMAREIVLGAEDKWSNHWTYQSFLVDGPSEKASRLFSVYLFNVSNPARVLAGDKPVVTEVGPFAYVRKTRRYDVTFSSSSSGGQQDLVSYKTWDYFEAVTDMTDCREMFFRMGHSYYSPTKTDCKGVSCYCKPDQSAKVTVVNPRFFRLISQYTPSGVLARLSQPYFSTTHSLFTVNFVSSLRAYYSVTVLPVVYRYRRWQHVASTLADLYDWVTIQQGTPAAAIVLLQADHTTTRMACPSRFQVPGESYCTWGSASYIYKGFSGQTGNYSALSSTEATNLLDTATWGSLLHSPASMDLWVSAARHLGVIAQLPLSVSRDYQGYRTLLSVFCSWGGYGVGSRVCAGKVKGVVYYLHAWSRAPDTLNRTTEEWARGSGHVACDTDDDRSCNWALRRGAGAALMPGREALLDEAAAGIANATVGALFESQGTGSSAAAKALTVTDMDNMNDWVNAARYCARLATGSNGNCSALTTAYTLATSTLPAALMATGSSGSNLTSVACGVALYLKEGWGGVNNTYMDRALAAYLNTLGLGHTFNESSLEDAGYMQWGSGAVTYALRSVRSTYNLKTPGVWQFTNTCYRQGPLEFSAYAARAGYPHMTLSVSQARTLLQALSNDTDQGQLLRRKLISSVTTYKGDGVTSVRGIIKPSQRAFTTHAITPDYLGDTDGSGYTISEDDDDTAAYNISMILNGTYSSASGYCSKLETWYSDCEDLIALGDTQIQHCSMYETISTDPSFGIVCSSSLVNDELGDHAHPWPRTVGHTLLALMRAYTWSCVVEEDRLTCPDTYASGGTCDYAHGGAFITGGVRDVLFGGYSDPLTDRLVNLIELAPRGLSLSCLDAPRAQWSDDCDALLSVQCSRGYSVTHDTYGPVLNVTRPADNGSEAVYGQWYEADWSLPHGLGSIDSPVAGVYLGEMVQNQSFQMRQDCDPRTLSGPGDRYRSCVTRMQSGHRSYSSTQVLSTYLGNTSIGPSSSASLQVSSGTEGRQFPPSFYSGFRNYTFPYKGLYYGEEALGPWGVTMVAGREGVALGLSRVGEDAQDKFYLQYPTRYAYDYNRTQVAYIPLNRYREDKATWTALQSLFTSSTTTDVRLLDHLGMPYTPPLGLFPTHQLSGLSSFIGSPHFLANKLYASKGEFVKDDVTGLSPDEARHRTALDVEPVSGRTMRTGKRLQVSVRLERSSLLYDVVSSQKRCPVPTATYSKLGYGCFAYVPLLWVDDQDVATTQQALHFVDTYQGTPDTVYQVGAVGLGLAGLLYLMAAALLWRNWRRYRDFKQKVFIDF